MKTKPRLFRSRRRGPDLFIGRDPLPTVRAWIEANRSRFKPGVVTEVEVIHDAGCEHPRGKPCTCRSGPEIRIKGEDPRRN